MAQKHFEPGTKVSLSPLGPALAEARTTAIVKGRQLEVMRVVLLAGKSMKEHKVPGEMTVQCLEGCIELRTPQTVYVLNVGDFIYLEAALAHSLQAVSDASALVTLFVGAV